MANHWIVVADGARARFFEADVELEEMRFLNTLRHPRSRMKSGDLVTDNAGRDRRGGQGGSFSGSDAHDHEVELFSRELAAALADGLEKRSYERLVLVAPPGFLGVLREQLSPQVSGAIVASLSKDYSRLPSEQILAQVRAQLPEDAGLPSHVR